MTKSEIRAHLEAKAAKMIQWFDERDLPPNGLKIDQCTTIVDMAKCIDICKVRIQAHKGNPFHVLYIQSYKTLEKIKNTLEDGEIISH